MKERLKRLRKALDLTQQEFADRIGIKRNSFANYETGRNTPIDAIIISICREFNVNEEWLRTGVGEMFLPADRNYEITKLVNQLLSEESDSFKSRFISLLAEMTTEQWEDMERHARKLCGLDDKINAAIPDNPQELEKLYPPIDKNSDVG